MTERERWIVYPLLFLALGVALRDKLVDRTVTKSIVCQELQIIDEEPLGRQNPRVLARIGRATSKASGEAVGSLLLNGDIEIVDGDLAGAHPLHRLVEIGRAELTSGKNSVVRGQVFVDGIINAKLYTFQGVPFFPTMQPVPGMSLPDIIRALQQANQRKQAPIRPGAQPRDNQPQASPPDANSKDSGKAAPPASKADDEPPSAK